MPKGDNAGRWKVVGARAWHGSYMLALVAIRNGAQAEKGASEGEGEGEGNEWNEWHEWARVACGAKSAESVV